MVSGVAQCFAGSTSTLLAQSNMEIVRPSPLIRGKALIDGEVMGPAKGSGKLTVDGQTEISGSARLLNQIDICEAPLQHSVLMTCGHLKTTEP